jgi:hypothetical protein
LFLAAISGDKQTIFSEKPGFFASILILTATRPITFVYGDDLWEKSEDFCEKPGFFT